LGLSSLTKNSGKKLGCGKMKKIILIILILVIGVFIGTSFGDEITIFGPEDFIRAKGKPKTEEMQINPDGFEAPFTLHLRNGDPNGENRSSSAWVWLNGQEIFKPSDFNQQVFGYEVQVELENPSTLEVRLASAPESTLTIWIEGTPINPNARIVGPEGGTLEFYNGIVLQVPPGAIDREVAITIEDLPNTEMDSILQSYGLILKYFAGGFEGQPDGLKFNVPITVTIPVGPRESSGDLPLLFLVNRANGIYTLANTVLRYDPTASTVTAEILHFTDWVVAFGDDIHQEVDCNSPYWEIACKCKTITVAEVTEDTDVAGECFVKKVIGMVTFEDCPGKPNQDWTIREWERPDIDITPSPVEITSCTTSVTATVTNAEGEEIPNAWITWDTYSPHIWLSSATGKTVDVTVPSWVGEGNVGDIEARTGCDTYENASVRVSRPSDFILQIKKDRDFICSCQEMELTAEAFDTCEDATGQISGVAIPVRWDIVDGSDVVEKQNEIDPNGLVVRGLEEGFATIRATAMDKEEVFADITVEVRDPTVEIVPGEDFVLNIGDSKELDVLCTACPENLSWRTDNPGVVVLTDLGGDTVRVTANAPGTASVFAETVDHCGEQIGDLLTITVSAPGYTLTWNASYSAEALWETPLTPAGTSSIQWVQYAGLWQGSAVIDYNQNVTSFSTGGYLEANQTVISYFSGCTNTLTITQTNMWTISDSGAENIKNALSIVEMIGPDGRPYIRDPVGGMSIGFINVVTWDALGDDCDPSTPPTDEDWSTEGEEYTRFPGGSSGNLEPVDETGRSFSRNYVTIFSYLGPDQVPVEVTWQVSVEKSN
jgi:hypothetical protein